MRSRKAKRVRPARPEGPSEDHAGRRPGLCTRMGKYLRVLKNHWWLAWLFPVMGLLSLIWFLIRVIPKPTRVTYPCQRVAAPLASSFVVWLVGLLGSTLAYRSARRFVRQSRYVVAAFLVVVGIMSIWWSLSMTGDEAGAWEPSEGANSPMGVGKGIHPGRVVWIRDPEATSWDGSTGAWWQDGNTDQEVVDFMVSRTLRSLTGEPNDAKAWDALFRHFNQTRGLGNVGYQYGEQIAIKINMNQDSGGTWSQSAGMPSPHVIYSVLDQLINVVGVPGFMITVYDAARFIGDPIYNKVRSNPDPNFQGVRFVVRPDLARSGRSAANYYTTGRIYFANAAIPTTYVPGCASQAKYLINMALLRPHDMFGITLCGKNHFGSVRSNGNWSPSPLHDYGRRENAMGTYNCLVDLIGHKDLGGKTLLYMIDALYPARNQGDNVIRYSSFGEDWLSSIFVSQDPVAIDSVGLDFMRSEPRCTDVTGNPDNYLHEAALAHAPASGTFYDPDGDGTRLESLGVHEHWNSSVDRQYSRNLGGDEGIELVVPPLTSPEGPIENVTAAKRYDYIRLAIYDASPGDQIVLEPGTYDEKVDFNGKQLTVRSVDPNDPDIVAATIITGGSDGVIFANGEGPDCVLAGITVTDANAGIYCSGGSPTITNCRIVGNAGAGIVLRDQSNATIINCIIADNGGAGVEVWAQPGGRWTIYSYATLTNCTIVRNGQHGIWGGGVTTMVNCTVADNGTGGVQGPVKDKTGVITNSILWNSGPSEIEGIVVVSYSDVKGGLAGQGNLNVDPCFVDPNNGDYHLKSEAGRWDSGSYTWVQDDVTSLCIDAGDPNSDWTDELWPHGKRMNMGAYGGTPEASMSLSDLGSVGDLDHNGVVDMRDYAIFAAWWLVEDVLVAEDLDRGGSVDLVDVGILADNWLYQEQ